MLSFPSETLNCFCSLFAAFCWRKCCSYCTETGNTSRSGGSPVWANRP
ncbi:hypothetical protein AB205_0107090 [Aquarana catesbeiana]|uniref:Uncharacterized protein n=1 Tax=Aquarana catesbeiana TaxID=8400 RepID=A0A2G9Q4R1_AQUCT|nr:hypothetical protein AB205_0107090 [Aquarana catesbeiana]